MAKGEEGPDQPRSWAIALAACTINTLLSGISRTTGLFYVALIETYGVSRLEANLPFTLRNVIRNLGGPLAGAIGQRYGAREVTIVGGVFAAAGITLCTFAPNVIWICVLWGGIHGFGVALGNTLFQVTVNQYFLKYRATASGIALSGACIGSFVFPVALEYMLTHLGLPGTFLITGACILHVLPAGIMMKEPPWIRRQMKERKKLEKLEGATSFQKNEREILPPKMSIIQEEESTHGTEGENISIKNMRKIPSSEMLKENENSGSDIGSYLENMNSKNCNQNGIDNPAFLGSQIELSEKVKETEFAEEFISGVRLRTISIGEGSVTIAPPPGDVQQEVSLSKGIKKVFRDPMFHMISVSLAGFAMLFDPAITVIVDYLKDKGMEEDTAKYFISMMSLGDLLGRLCFGWVTDKNYMSVTKFMMLIQVLQGVCFILLPFFHTFDILMTVIVIYGLLSGATLVMFPILVSKYLASVQSLAIGFISIFTGILSFAVPPLIGYFRDHVGSYDGMFMITGILSAAIGCLWLCEPLLLKLRKTGRSASIVISS